MANNLRKFKFTGSAPSAGPREPGSSSPPSAAQADSSAMKAEILSSLKADIAAMFRQELKTALSDDFEAIKTELHMLKTELANNTATMRSEVEAMKITMADMGQALSSQSDEVTSLQNRVDKLESEVNGLREKCLDMEGRMRRSNIRIINIPESAGSSSPTAVSKLLRDVLQMDKDILIDRSHRGGPARNRTGRPRVIIAQLHYHQDCMEILRRARESGPLRWKGADISIFPDYPPSVAQARAAFGEVRRLLRGREGVKYGLMYPARLRITHNGTEKWFQNAEEATAYVKSTIAGSASTK